MKDRKVKQILSGGGYQCERDGPKERVREGKYGRFILYSCIKMEK
jgi:hypothetical protein